MEIVFSGYNQDRNAAVLFNAISNAGLNWPIVNGFPVKFTFSHDRLITDSDVDNSIANIVSSTFAPQSLSSAKSEKCELINSVTDSIIAQGFKHPTKSHLVFGLEVHDQNNFLGLNQMRMSGTNMSTKFFRLKSNSEHPEVLNYVFDDNSDFDITIAKGMGLIEWSIRTGGEKKDIVNASNDYATIDAVTDTRTWEEANAAVDALLGY